MPSLSLRSGRAGAFTLIELLVVIAIVAILAAILFPVFAQAKAAAKKTVALANFKQTGTASVLYASDYDGYLARVDSGGYDWPLFGASREGDDTLVLQQLQPYMKGYEVSVDPMDPLSLEGRVASHLSHLNDLYGLDPKDATPFDIEYGKAVRTNIGYNSYFFSPFVFGVDANGYYIGSASISDTEVSNPAETLMWGSSIWDRDPSSGEPFGGGNWQITAPCVADENGKFFEPMSRFVATSYDGYYTDFYWMGGWSDHKDRWNVYGGLWPWHNQRPVPGTPGLKDGYVIVGYADGHVQAKPLGYTIQGCQPWPQRFTEEEGPIGGTITDRDKYIWDFE